MISLAIWIRRLTNKILYVFPWLKRRKSATKNAYNKKQEKQEKQEYRYKVCAAMDVTSDDRQWREKNKKLLSEKIYSGTEQDAIQDAFLQMKTYYDRIGHKTILEDNKLTIDFEDGMVYVFSEPEIILIKDSDTKKSLRDLNTKAKKLVKKMTT